MATGWCSTPGLVASNNRLVINACEEAERLSRTRRSLEVFESQLGRFPGPCNFRGSGGGF
jgi:hypothetical protein